MCDSAGRMWREGHSGEHVASLLSASPVFWGGWGGIVFVIDSGRACAYSVDHKNVMSVAFKNVLS